ncbi:MAG: tagaturonate epimerase family protein [Phycisphaeraceae bacterium]
MSTLPSPVTLGLSPSFGFGDRTGLATPGHVAAMKRAGSGIDPMYPQQSIREMARTNRQPREVMDDALRAMVASGWTVRTGADADHLKTPEDVDRTAAVGFTFFTIDPSGYVDRHADNYHEAAVRAKFEQVRAQIAWVDLYKGKSIKLTTGTTINLDEQSVLRCAVKYGIAINQAIVLAAYIRHVAETASGGKRDYEIELSVDETDQPTTAAEHYIIADQCLRHGMKLVSLAPRFIGDFEKGVDFKGDIAAFEKSLADHAAIAALLGPYKLSLHSGSDKLSMYTPFARATKGMFHVKTAGTSYLEAIRVVARHDEKLFREVVRFSRERYDTDKATYHVSATLASAPPADQVKSAVELEQHYLQRWCDIPADKIIGFTAPGRQILHCTFGSVLTNKDLGPKVRAVLEAHPDTYKEVLADHFAKHLEALKAGM